MRILRLVIEIRLVMSILLNAEKEHSQTAVLQPNVSIAANSLYVSKKADLYLYNISLILIGVGFSEDALALSIALFFSF